MEHTVWLDNGKLASNPILKTSKIKILFKFDISRCRARLAQQIKLFDGHGDCVCFLNIRPGKKKGDTQETLQLI